MPSVSGDDVDNEVRWVGKARNVMLTWGCFSADSTGAYKNEVQLICLSHSPEISCNQRSDHDNQLRGVVIYLTSRGG